MFFFSVCTDSMLHVAWIPGDNNIYSFHYCRIVKGYVEFK